jgi:hypothetical protein
MNVLTEKARAFLKSMGSKPHEGKKEPPVPIPPEDPDRLDPRVEDASPTEEDVTKAKEGASKGEGKAEEEGEGDGENDTSSDPKGESSPETDKDPKKDDTTEDDSTKDEGFDAFGNRDLKTREAKKALIAEGHDDPLKLPKKFNPEDVIEGLLERVGDLQLIVEELASQVESFKRTQAASTRDLKKALDSSQELRDALSKLHTTAPAASAPRAITKGLPGAEGHVTPLMTRAELMALAGSGQLTPFEIARLNSHLQTTAFLPEA